MWGMANPARIPLRVIALVGVTVVLATVATIAGWGAPLEGAFWFWLAACFVSELVWVRLPVGQATVSMASCFQFAALLLLPRGQVMLIAAISSVVAESLVMRKPPLRALFNAGQSALAVGAAAAVLTLLAPGVEVRELVYGARLLPLMAAATVYFVVNTGSVALAIALSERVPIVTAWLRNFGRLRHLLINTALYTLGALLASHYANNGMVGTTLVTTPLVIALVWARQARHRAAALPDVERQAA